MCRGVAVPRHAAPASRAAVGRLSATRAVGCMAGLPAVGDRSSTASTRQKPSGSGEPYASRVTCSGTFMARPRSGTGILYVYTVTQWPEVRPRFGTHLGAGPTTARGRSPTRCGLQGQRTHRFFIEGLAPGKQTLERLRIENGFKCSEQLCASAPCVLAPPRFARVAEQARR